MTQDTILNVAIDDGFARIKLFGETADGRIAALSLPSSIRSGSAGSISSLHGDGRVGFYKTDEGQFFTVSPDVAGESTRFDDFHISQINRVLVAHALMEADYAGKKVRLVTSLPINEYYKDGQRNETRIKAKQENLKRAVLDGNGTPLPVEIVDVKVGCQALAAYFDLTLDQNGQEVLTGLESTAIVDIGGSTTDIAVILYGQSIDDTKTGASKIGVLDVHAAVSRRLGVAFGVGEQIYPARVMDAALRTKRIRLHGTDHDVSEIIEASINEVSEKLLRDINQRIGNAALLDKVIFVGGGANVFQGLASNWLNADVLPDPAFANARGLLKYIRRFQPA